MSKENLSKKIKINDLKLQADVKLLADKIKRSNKLYKGIYAIPRGGTVIAYLLQRHLDLPIIEFIPTYEDVLIVDDLIDSGETIKKYKTNDIAVLYIKKHSPKPKFYVEQLNGWIEFYYENTDDDIYKNVTRILEYLGEDPTREGLLDTPKRYIKFLKQFTATDKFNFTVFNSEKYDEMIIQKNIPFFSLCEHHIAPFFGHATVAYIPNKKIVGLSKLARTVELYSRKLQNQERITDQIAERLQKELKPKGVAVTLTARHFCMEMRGVETHDVFTTTTKLLGAFKKKPETRQEFLNQL